MFNKSLMESLFTETFLEIVGHQLQYSYLLSGF